MPGLCEYCLRGGRDARGICPLCGYDGVPTNPPQFLPEGTAVGGRYMVGRQEGHGGFSICYRAWDGQSREIVAIKELFPWEVAERYDDGRVGIDNENRPDFQAAVESLCHEGQVLQQLSREPGIVRVGEVFTDNGTVYLPMEFLRGQSYEHYLYTQYIKNDEPLDVEAAVNVALAVLSSLEAVHKAGLLHLDIKPTNVRVLDDGRSVLLDFGSARNAFRQGNGPYGDTFTPGFAAPEQHSAEAEVSRATDVYAMAATLYYSLSLQVPTRADDRLQGIELPPISQLNPKVPQALDLIIRKAMSLDPRERFQQVEAFHQALEPFATGRPVPAVRPAAPMVRRRVAALLDLSLILALLAGLTAAFQLEAILTLAAGVGLWIAIQLFATLNGATPGMVATRLRLRDQRGGGVSFWPLMLRTLMQFLGVVTLQLRADANGLLRHDRASRTRVETI